VPVRELELELALAVTRTVPSPVPPFGVTVNHEALFPAVHAQPVCVFTATKNAPPVPGTDACDGDIA
jgi:hypothetical protein